MIPNKWTLVAILSTLTLSCSAADQIKAKSDMDLAPEIRCIGTEPFWNMTLDKGKARFQTMDGQLHEFELATEPVAATDVPTWTLVGHTLKDATSVHATLQRTQQCSDNMSDYAYEYALKLIIGDAAPLNGCCTTLQKNP